MIFKKKPKPINEEQFWNWFLDNNKKYLFLNQIEDQELKNNLLEEFKTMLHRYCDSLFFEIGGHEDAEKVELIITAEGNQDYFSHVENLVSASPNYKDWDIIAFKPPMGKGFITELGNKTFDPAEIIFIPLINNEDPKAVGLNVCFADYSEKEREIYISGLFQVFDCLIGEKSTCQDIDFFDVIKTPADIDNYDIWHLEDIKEYIDEKKYAS